MQIKESVFSKNADFSKFGLGEFAKYGVHELNVKRIIIRIFRLYIRFNCKIKKEKKRKKVRKKERKSKRVLTVLDPYLR